MGKSGGDPLIFPSGRRRPFLIFSLGLLLFLLPGVLPLLAFNPDLAVEYPSASLSKKALLEEGRYKDLLDWIDRYEPDNEYLKGVLNSKLTNVRAAVSNFLLCTNDANLRYYSFYNIGLALRGKNGTNCLPWFRKALTSDNPFINYQSELQTADLLVSLSNKRSGLEHYLKALEIVQRWERSQPTLLPFLGHSYLTRLLTSLTLTARDLGDPRYRAFGYRALAMNQPNRYNPFLSSLIQVMSNSQPQTFDENFHLFRHLSGMDIRSARTAGCLDECLKKAPSTEALVQVMELGFGWWLPRNREQPERMLRLYGPRLDASGLEDGVLYLKMMLAWSRRDQSSVLSNFSLVFNDQRSDPEYEAKTLSFYLDYMQEIPADPKPLEILLQHRRSFATNEGIVTDLFQYSLSKYFRNADPAGALAFLTNLPSRPEHEFFIARCLVMQGRKAEALGRFRSIILSGSSDYYTWLCLSEVKNLYKTEKEVQRTNINRSVQILNEIIGKDIPISELGRRYLEILSLNPDFILGADSVDAILRDRPGLSAGPAATNDRTILRLKGYFDASLVEEGSVELLLNDRNDLPFCLTMAEYFNKSGYSYLQIKYAERVQRLLQIGFPAWRIRHPIVSYLYPEWYRREVLTLSHRWGLAPSLVYAIVREESRFRHDALSRSGASGLMQLMPSTFSYIMNKKSDPVSSGAITSPAANIYAGTAFLKDLLLRYGDEYKAVAAYNAGPANLDKWIKRFNPPDDAYFLEFIPFPETQSYVMKVLTSQLGYNR